MSKVVFLNTFYNPEIDEEIKNWEMQQSLKDHYWRLNKLDKYDYAVHKKKMHDILRKEIHIVRDNK